MWDRIKARLPLFLFGLPFAAIGIGMFVTDVSASLLEWQQMKSWQAVEAHFLNGGYESSQGSDATTYQAYADYTYRWNGTQYRSTRVAIASGGDNIGHFHQTLGRRLERAVQNGQTLPVWVNPQNPDQAVVSRDLRWELLGFEMIFVLVFGGLGITMMLGALFSSQSSASSSNVHLRATKPWLNRPEWASADVRCGGRRNMWFAWCFAIFWNLVSAPAGFGGAEAISSGNWSGIVALLFPLIGAGLLVWAVRLTLNWRRFGRITLHMDPYPGAIGGQAGGWFDLNLPYRLDLTIKATLLCLERYTTGSGKNRKTRERCLWQSSGIAYTQPQSVGSRVELLFDVPDHLPESSEPDEHCHLWRLEVSADLPGTDFARQFEIPVFKTAERAQSVRKLSVDHPMAHQARSESLSASVKVTQLANGLELYSPPFANAGSKVSVIVVGLVFIASGIGFGGIALLFTLIGALMVVSALYSILLGLRVRIDSQQLSMEKHLLGLPLGHTQISRQSLNGLMIDKGYASGNNEYFELKAVCLDGRKITLARNLAGRDAAGQFMEDVRVLAGMAA